MHWEYFSSMDRFDDPDEPDPDEPAAVVGEVVPALATPGPGEPVEQAATSSRTAMRAATQMVRCHRAVSLS
jgi:hypothetical protein